MNNAFKIGKTDNLNRRLGQLKTGNPYIEDYYEYFELKEEINPYHTETALHNSFKNKKIKGEWFELDINDFNNMNIILKNKINRHIIIDLENHYSNFSR